MIKASIVIMLVILTAVLVLLFAQLTQNGVKITKGIGLQVILGIAMNLLYLISVFVNDELVLQNLYALIVIVEGWIWYMFLRYAYERMHKWKLDRAFSKKVSISLIVVYNILLLVNASTELFYKFQMQKIEGNIFVCTEWSVLSIAHLGGTGFIGFLVVVVMLMKAQSVPRLYRLRYIATGVMFALGTIGVLLFRILTANMNILPVVYVTFGILGMYYIYFQYPLHRAAQMKTYAINNMTDPVLMFDYNDNLQVYNDAAERMLGAYSYYTLQEYIADNELYYKVEERKQRQATDREFTRTKVMNARTYLIHGQELWDKKGRFVGTLIVYTDITGQERLKDEATLYATRDQLTGLWNRDYFFEIVGKTIRENYDEEFLMIATDIYQFKLFNEILGTGTGDDLLLAFAQAYRERYKRMWVFSRISGDRFALLIPKSDYKEDVFLNIVHDVLERRHYSMKVHCYVGVYEILDRNINVESMYDRAYMALESIKGNMQKEIAYYQDEILNQRIHETTTLDELDRGLLNDEFVIYLQPQLEIATGKIASAEALIRWNKPGRGIVSPSEFIPVFENNGMIAKLDYYVWELACRQLAKWKEEGHAERSISVNISAKDFYLSDLYESITSLVEKYKIDPLKLKLEITETAFVLDVEKQMDLVRKLQDYGFVIEIDDFGSGYSSLNSLKDIVVDVLKMDLKFFEKTNEAGRAEKIVNSVVRLANELGMPVIAEGVESEEDLEMLKTAGCQMIQGYYFAKPMSIEEYEEFLENYSYGDMKGIITQVKNTQ